MRQKKRGRGSDADSYLQPGTTSYGLAKRLTDLGLPTPTGKPRWNLSTLRGIWVDDLKALPQVTILEVTEANRDHMAQRVLSLLDITSTAAR